MRSQMSWQTERVSASMPTSSCPCSQGWTVAYEPSDRCVHATRARCRWLCCAGGSFHDSAHSRSITQRKTEESHMAATQHTAWRSLQHPWSRWGSQRPIAARYSLVSPSLLLRVASSPMSSLARQLCHSSRKLMSSLFLPLSWEGHCRFSPLSSTAPCKDG